MREMSQRSQSIRRQALSVVPSHGKLVIYEFFGALFGGFFWDIYFFLVTHSMRCSVEDGVRFGTARLPYPTSYFDLSDGAGKLHKFYYILGVLDSFSARTEMCPTSIFCRSGKNHQESE